MPSKTIPQPRSTGSRNMGFIWHHKKINRKWLNDDLINASQKVLAKQFEHKFSGAGFQTTTNGLCGNYTVETGEFIQILHNGTDHWLAITTIGTKFLEALVYDSLCLTFSGNDIKAQISSLLCTQQCAIKIPECCEASWRV